MRLKHHRFRFGLIGNLKVLLCRIFGHRVNNDPAGFTCQRCRLAYEEIYYPEDYWKEMIQFMKPKPENVVTKELVAELVDELMKHTWFPSTEHQVDLFERCAPYLDIPEMPESLNHPPIFPRRGAVEDSSPILDGSEMIGEETVDEYLDRIVAQKGKENPFDTAKNVLDGMLGIGGIPSNEEFCEELIARLCDAFGLADFTGLKWKEGAPEQEGWYIWVDKHYPTRTLGYWEPRTFWPSAILYHIGPIPPVPQNDAE